METTESGKQMNPHKFLLEMEKLSERTCSWIHGSMAENIVNMKNMKYWNKMHLYYGLTLDYS